MAPRPRKVLLSIRASPVTLTELDALAATASRASGRPVTRSDVARQILADGIRRAHSAARYAARFAGEPPEASKGA